MQKLLKVTVFCWYNALSYFYNQSLENPADYEFAVNEIEIEWVYRKWLTLVTLLVDIAGILLAKFEVYTEKPQCTVGEKSKPTFVIWDHA